MRLTSARVSAVTTARIPVLKTILALSPVAMLTVTPNDTTGIGPPLNPRGQRLTRVRGGGDAWVQTATP